MNIQYSKYIIATVATCTINNKILIADSAQTEYCSTFHCSSVSPCVTGVTSRISHIYKGINAKLIIRATHQTLYILIQNHPVYLSSKDQARQEHRFHPDGTNH